MDLSTEIWNEFKEENGLKILVTGEADNLKSAFFKSQTRRPGAPTIFNEYLAYKLASLIGYPVPKVQFLKFAGELGIISLNIPESGVFQGFPKDNLFDLFDDNKIFAKIAAFDYWIKSTDRHDRNLIVQRVGLNKYQVYMIDHEHSLYGADPTPSDALDFSNIIKIDNFKTYISNQEMLIEEADKIADIDDNEIKNLVELVRVSSEGNLTDECATLIKDLLIQRKPLIKDKLLEWYNS